MGSPTHGVAQRLCPPPWLNMHGPLCLLTLIGGLTVPLVLCAEDDVRAQCAALKQQLDDVDPILAELKANMTAAKEELASARAENLVQSRTGSAAAAADVVVIFDATLTGYSTKCGAQTITGWVETLDVYYEASGATASTTQVFSPTTGTFTAPSKGYYVLCAFARFQKGGNSVDVTIKVSGARVAAFGDAVGLDWRSTGTCTIQKLAAAATATVHIESGGGSDCVEETGWYYARFNGYLIAVDP